MKNLLRLFGLAFALACLNSVSYAQGVGVLQTDPAITTAFHNRGAWSSANTYAANDVVSASGVLYYATAAIASGGSTPPGGSWAVFGGGSSGGGGLVPTGAYSSGTSYAVGNAVTYNGLLYASLTAANSGNNPATSTANWMAVADAPGAAAAASTAAAAAQTTANTAVTNAAAAQTTANTAVTNAAAAQTTANTAVTNAAAAQSTANAAATPASVATAVAAAQAVAAATSGTINNVTMGGTTPVTIVATKQLNSTYYVQSTIQAAVTQACAASAARVSIPAAATPSDTIAAVTGGCSTVSIVDERPGVAVTYTWNTTTSSYQAGSPGNAFVQFGLRAGTPAAQAAGTFVLASPLTAPSSAFAWNLPSAPCTPPTGATNSLIGVPAIGTSVDSQGRYSASITCATPGTDYVTPTALTAAIAAVTPASIGAATPSSVTTAVSAATTQAALTSVLTPPVAGATMELSLDGNSSTTYTDLSGNSNNGTMGTGSNAPTNYPGQGVGFNDVGFTFTNYNVITTPLTDWGTVVIAKCTPLLGTTTGISNGSQFNSYPAIFGSTATSTGVELLSYPFNLSGYVTNGTMDSPNIFNNAGGAATSGIAGGVAGCHRFEYTAGTSGTSVDHFYIDGVEVSSYAAEAASRALIPVTGGATYEIGTGKNANNFGARGLYTYVMTYATALTSSQISQVDAYVLGKLTQRPALLSRLYPKGSTVRARTLIGLGDSLTASFQGTAQWTTLLSLNNTYSITNTGIGGFFADEMCQYFESRTLPLIAQGETTILYWGGTNDFNGGRLVADILQSDGCVVAKAHKYGARVILATMISRSGTNTTYSTNDGAKVALNTARRNNWQRMGFDGLADLAEPTLLGANGAYSNSCFYSDGVHLTSTACGININTTTSLSGYGAVAAIMSNAVNSLDGSSAVSPDQLSTTTTALTAANNNVIITPTAAATATLADCQGRGIPQVITNGAAATYSITVSAILSETITGSTTIAPLATAIFQPVPTGGAASTTGGCFWIRTQ